MWLFGWVTRRKAGPGIARSVYKSQEQALSGTMTKTSDVCWWCAWRSLQRPPGARSLADLWLRYDRDEPAQLRSYRQAATAIILQNSSPTVSVIAGADAWSSWAARRRRARGDRHPEGRCGGVGTPSQSPVIAALGWTDRLARLGDEGH